MSRLEFVGSQLPLTMHTDARILRISVSKRNGFPKGPIPYWRDLNFMIRSERIRRWCEIVSVCVNKNLIVGNRASRIFTQPYNRYVKGKNSDTVFPPMVKATISDRKSESLVNFPDMIFSRTAKANCYVTNRSRMEQANYPSILV